MKKTKASLLLMLICCCLLATSWSAVAASTSSKTFGYIDPQTNRSFVPIRFLSRYAGANVKWSAAEQRIEIKGEKKTVVLFVDKKHALVNDERIVLEDAPFIDNQVTYVPLRFVSEALGVKLEWRAATSSVLVTHDGLSTVLPMIKRGMEHDRSAPIVSERKTYKVGSRSFSVQLVTVSLMHPKVSLDVALAEDTVGKVESLKSMAERNKAILAINGTFFDAYTESDYKIPYGYIAGGGELLMDNRGNLRTIVTYDSNNFVQLIAGAKFTERFNDGVVEGALQAGPRLLVDGKVELNVDAEGFKDPKILTGGGARSALGVTRDHKLLLMTTGGATIPQLAELMKQAGAYQAMNLDGGASSGLYYDGKYLTTPGRLLSNALLIKLD